MKKKQNTLTPEELKVQVNKGLEQWEDRLKNGGHNTPEVWLKDKLHLADGIEVRKSERHGYGVFATKFIFKNDIVEECVVPYQVIPPGYEYMNGEIHYSNSDIMNQYRFNGPPNPNGYQAFWITPTGLAMVYNHSRDANIIWQHHTKERIISFKATKDIKPGEELVHDYTKHFDPYLYDKGIIKR